MFQREEFSAILNHNFTNQEMMNYYSEKGYDLDEVQACEYQKLMDVYSSYDSDEEFIYDQLYLYASKIVTCIKEEYKDFLTEKDIFILDELVQKEKNHIVIVKLENSSTKVNGHTSFSYAKRKNGSIYFCPEVMDLPNSVEQCLAMKSTMIHEICHLLSSSKDKNHTLDLEFQSERYSFKSILGKWFDEGVVEKSAMDLAISNHLYAKPSLPYFKYVRYVELVLKQLGMHRIGEIFNRAYDKVLLSVGEDVLEDYKQYERDLQYQILAKKMQLETRDDFLKR